MKTSGLLLLGSLVASATAYGGRPEPKYGKYKPKSHHKWGPPSWKPSKPWKWPQWGGYPHPGKGGEQPKPLVSASVLADLIDVDDLVAGSEQLQAFSDAYWQKNRVFGSAAHLDTVNYLYDQVDALGYYDVWLQEQVHPWSDANQTLSVDGVEYEVTGATYGPNGDVSSLLVAVDNLGCDATDFPTEAEGNIALISRGTCPFATKVALAGAAGAVGAVIYNNVAGTVGGTLGSPTSELGPYVPIVFVTLDVGTSFLANISTGLTADLLVNAVNENRTTYNVIAQTKGGDAENVVALGAHSDSVNAGPGINDDGSGSIGILAVAKALTNFSLTNAVRFHWWTAEEYGLLGSEFYVASLNQTELDKIALYLNFDMIASPNYIYAIYDGDGSAFNLSGPSGSAEIESLFEEFFADRNLASVPTEFNGRSDYGPFLDVGIPSGGLFTGAEDNKTEEEAALFGGDAGVAYDACYHAACDNITNLALDAFEINTQAIAYSIGTYASSLSSLPSNGTASARRRRVKREVHKDEHKVHSCSHEVVVVEL